MLSMRKPDWQVRDATRADWPTILDLNKQWERYFSPMNEARLEVLSAASCYFRVVESVGMPCAFLIAFRKGAPYDGTIFKVFEDHTEDFIYLDRIAVADSVQGNGVANDLYADALSFARSAGVRAVLCEINTVPSNPVSQRFHDRWGFCPIGSHSLKNGNVVTLLKREL